MSEPTWRTRGKTIAELIDELRSFEDQSLEVRISTDDGETHSPISLVVKQAGACVLVHAPAEDSA